MSCCDWTYQSLCISTGCITCTFCNQSLDFVRVSFYNASKTVMWFFCSLLAGNLSVLTVPRSLFPSIKSIFCWRFSPHHGTTKTSGPSFTTNRYQPYASELHPSMPISHKESWTGRMSHCNCFALEAHKSNQPHMTPLSTHLVFSQWRLGVQFTVVIGNPGFS